MFNKGYIIFQTTAKSYVSKDIYGAWSNRMLPMRIRDVMTSDPKYIEIPSTRQTALILFQKHQVNGLPVLKEGTRKLVGLITLRDFAKNPDEEQVAIIMTRDVPVVDPDDDFTKACEVMVEQNTRHIPVVFESMLVGIVTVKDVLSRAIGQMDPNIYVREIFSDRATAIWEETPLMAAYIILEASKSRTVPVVDAKGKVVGIISDVDIMRAAEIRESTTTDTLTTETEGDLWSLEGKNMLYVVSKNLVFPEDKTVEDLMTKEVGVGRRTPLKRCAKVMVTKDLKEIPVMTPEGELVGIVRDMDLLKAVLNPQGS
jgi:CBS domain-containing protein